MARGTCVGPLLLACAMALGCTSPEAERTRGGGGGADAGNRADAVPMHGGSDPFWATPNHIGDAHPPLDPARQARRISQP